MTDRFNHQMGTWGEETFEHRALVRELTLHREPLLRGQRVDPRLVGFVWSAAPARLETFVTHDLTDTAWLDQKVADENFSVVPVLNLEAWERGVVTEGGALYERDEYMEHPVELSWVWEQIFEPGLRAFAEARREGQAVPDEMLDEDGDFDLQGILWEFGQLGGAHLWDFAEPYLDGSVFDDVAVEDAAEAPVEKVEDDEDL